MFQLVLLGPITVRHMCSCNDWNILIMYAGHPPPHVSAVYMILLINVAVARFLANWNPMRLRSFLNCADPFLELSV